MTQHRSPSETEARVMELEEEWDTQEPQKETRVRQTEPSEDDTWEPNPLPLMVKHPPRIMTSNTKIQLQEAHTHTHTHTHTHACSRSSGKKGWNGTYIIVFYFSGILLEAKKEKI